MLSTLDNFGLSAVEGEKRKLARVNALSPSLSQSLHLNPEATMAAVLSTAELVANDKSSMTPDNPSFALVIALLTEEIQALNDARVAQRLHSSYTIGHVVNQRGGGAPVLDLTDDSEGEVELGQIDSLQKQLDILLDSTSLKSPVYDQKVNERKRARAEENEEGVFGIEKVQKLMVRFSRSLYVRKTNVDDHTKEPD